MGFVFTALIWNQFVEDYSALHLLFPPLATHCLQSKGHVQIWIHTVCFRGAPRGRYPLKYIGSLSIMVIMTKWHDDKDNTQYIWSRPSLRGYRDYHLQIPDKKILKPAVKSETFIAHLSLNLQDMKNSVVASKKKYTFAHTSGTIWWIAWLTFWGLAVYFWVRRFTRAR